ncbi:hypothetical protein VP01_4034g1 [Puccinia sorghi]|uniref:Uncharacterized protein n=1 Tax=Puccinia sorghi TaxID=27349 RepID=A0A0L6UTM8_9BASI|nr:hypothetical protein VP01_4034g1 [Puccinia sorghi]
MDHLIQPLPALLALKGGKEQTLPTGEDTIVLGKIVTLISPLHEVDPESLPDNCGIKAETVALPPESQAEYPLDDPRQSQSLEFFKKATGIQDGADLKSHIIKIRDAAYARFPYPCIWGDVDGPVDRDVRYAMEYIGFEFLKGKNLSHPFYAEMKRNCLLPGEEVKIFVDLGTFVGVDLRQVVGDGFDANNVLGIDIHSGKTGQGFLFFFCNEFFVEWRDLGHQLFKDGEGAPPFYLGDIFKTKTLNQEPASAGRPGLDLRTLKDLNSLKGRVSFISANQLFHLFSEEDQVKLAERCAQLLSLVPGAAIFGTQLGLPKEKLEDFLSVYLPISLSWEKLWRKVLGEKIKVTVKLEEAESHHPYRDFSRVGDELHWLYWSVARTA